MDSRVYLNKTPLSLLSIPRTRAWLFAAAILALLSKQAALAAADTNSPYISELDSEEDSDCDEEVLLQRHDSEDPLTSSFMSSGSGSGTLKKSALARLSSQTDNSSKYSPVYHSPKGSVADLSLIRTKTEEEDEIEQEAEESFFHIAYTSTECTVICATTDFEQLFKKPLSVCLKLGYTDVVVINNLFFSLQVDNEGQDNGSERILEFTQPLSELGISLFFLSSHYSDIVLIPQSFRDQVIEILALKNFVYSPNTNSYMVGYEQRDTPFEQPATLKNLQEDTHQLFKTANIRPKIHKNKKCLLTGARPGEVKSCIEKTSACIAAGTVPEYFAMTRTANDEMSLLLPGSSRKRAHLGFDSRSIVGLLQDAIIPITVDLSKLPLDSTGIVAGLASSLLESMKATDPGKLATFEMNYLSMACSAVIMIPEENLAIVTKMIDELSSND